MFIFKGSVLKMPELPMPLWVAVFLFFGSLVLGSLGAMFGMSKGEPDSLQQLAWISGGAVCAQIPIVFVYSMFVKPTEFKQSVRTILITFFLFTPLALGTAGLAHALFSTIGWERPNELGHETLQHLQNAEFSPSVIVVVLAATLGAGVVEEICFRGVLLPSLPKIFPHISVWGAIVTTSVIFSSMHIGAVPLSSLLGLVVLSVGLCWARAKSGGVFAPICIHILFNAFNVAFVL
ncbi:MAG: type II CAAX endopeptidase family protein [Phycisphaerales bacterium]|nr:type II CAAX endopeptidase family protein [Phycisphaerales bacterium]